jgi:uncharacterized membrane protein
MFFCLSLTPSLLPRSWWVQGLVTGISTTLGYGLGVLTSHLLRQVLPAEPPPRVKRVAWRLLAVGGLLAAVATVLLAGRWQQALHLRMGIEDPTQPAYLSVLLIAGSMVLALVLAGRGIRLAARAFGLRLRPYVPPRTAALTGATLAALLVIGIVQGLVMPGMLRATDRSFQTIDATVAEDLPRPTSRLVSGGPGAHTAWESLGMQGRQFIHQRTTLEDLEGVVSRAPKEPIRVYAGLDAAEDVSERAALVVAELERTGAFDREVLCVVGATGTGWINPVSAAALEYLHAGNTAIASMQYAYLPSWISFLVDRERPAEAGAELFAQVHRRWAELPADERPRLVVYGESLGSFAVESAFADLDDLTARTDGALLVGPPNFNPIWRELVRAREPGSLERLPVVDEGRTVRFAARPQDLDQPPGSWDHPRVVYLQHASDPVTWWSPRLLLRRPDWLQEPRGADVLERMRWYPLVTFWQLSADLVNADDAPPGYGHEYGTQVIDGWAAVAPPEDWGEADTRRLRAHLARLRE